MHYKKKQKLNARTEAVQQIKELFKQAEIRPNMANRYVSLAIKLSSRTKAKIPKELKSRFCKACKSFLTSKNSRIRLNKGKKTRTCLVCQSIKRTPYKA